MVIIPDDKLKEWEDHYHKSNINKQICLQVFLAQCAAVWGYDQGLQALDNLFGFDSE
jgi:hypothetical protein